ncbi:glycosyltransferase family 2 protein [Flavobacterium psychroterrae]|uniref:Glycosyltransferase family 2 protein n=1 Tax=Flavobacterium psychroterrae TaxID=2133767 RepID=A0ABS5PCR2_9FLAO|nr:glycosyltransferase family 2 protein [Flavobacterium psychroterrae]MBS7231901.1 glycosyltransferase family 2 protein [Flavobacterium psychroterrae]
MKKYLVKLFDFLRIESTLKKYYKWTKFRFVQFLNNTFNVNVIKQNFDYKLIPIIIISFNQLFYLKKLINFLKVHNYKNIVIIDNNSSYQPLIKYFNEIESTVTIHRLKQNYGHLVFWKVKELFEQYSNGYYAITDADINPIEECPEDFLLYFKKVLNKNMNITKVGYSLKIDDIPDTNFNKEKIVKWESQFWRSKTNEGDFKAGIDTTFALYRPKYIHDEGSFLRGCRTNFPYSARHGGWYINNNELTDEQIFYFKSCNDSSSWRVDKNGDLINQDYNI